MATTDHTNREREIFEAALDNASAEDRLAWLKEACGEDAALLARVQVLLQAHEAPESFLPEHPKDGATVSLATEKPGDRIGRYKLLEHIGEGGCGVVYMAEQVEPIRRRVALKVIKLGMDTKQVIGRFEAERQALALMDHPNIARVLDAGATETGRPYFVMELVRGVRITDYCDENSLSTPERLTLFVQVCQAIQHAHQKGIIHRDIKPSNILVSLNDGVRVPKVIDFGIAKAIGEQLSNKTVFTAFQQFIGTPAYMSPEQAVMTSLDIDTRSDIYALGVLLYELLTGRTPFDQHELAAAGLDEMRRIIREQEPLRPSTRFSTLAHPEQSTVAQRRHSEPPQLIHLLRGDLDWIVMKALEKDRSRRYETPNGLANDVLRHLSNEPVAARPPSRLYRFQKLVRRNKLVFAAGAAVTGALVLGLSLSTWLFFKERAAYARAVKVEQVQTQLRQQAEAGQKQAQTEAAKSQQVARFLKDMLEGVKPSVALGRDTTMLREILDTTTERVGKDLENQPEVEAELQYTLGDAYFELSEFEKAELLHRHGLELRRQLLGDDSLVVALSLSHLGRALLGHYKFAEAEDVLRQAVSRQRAALGLQHVDTLFSVNELSVALNSQGGAEKRKEAEALLREALETERILFGNESLEVAGTLEHLGVVLRFEGKPEETVSTFREALTIRRRSPEDQARLANCLTALAAALLQENQLAEAERLEREALLMQRKLYPSANPMLASSIFSLAHVLLKEGRAAEAEPLFRESLAMRKMLPRNEVFQIGNTLHWLGVALLWQKKLTDAEAVLGEEAALWKKLGSGYNVQAAGALYYLGQVLDEENRWQDAEAAFREAIDLRLKPGQKRAAAPDSYYWLGEVLRKQGRASEAVAAYRQSAEQGGLAAHKTLARMCLKGEGVARDEAEAMKWYRKIAEAYQKAADRGETMALNDLAWFLATCEFPAARDGPKALNLAKRAVTAAGRKDPALLDTLAAAYAETGQFTNAISTQKEAIGLLTDEARKKDFATRLQLYEANKPYHEAD